MQHIESTDNKVSSTDRHAINGEALLLRFPGELRNRIYEYAFGTRETKGKHYLDLFSLFFGHLRFDFNDKHRALLQICRLKQVCRQIRQETLHMQSNIFYNDHAFKHAAFRAMCMSHRPLPSPQHVAKVLVELSLCQFYYEGIFCGPWWLSRVSGLSQAYPEVEVMIILSQTGVSRDVRKALKHCAAIRRTLRGKTFLPGASASFRKQVAQLGRNFNSPVYQSIDL
ncbi:hypothetical protein BU23DRAFT_101001 [Bimuria novae-zelandiae CBS 107.79]|uniref:F-box domain-containing protein n=1 Tax=Bimuria novae-zelandiae CBS 107.79 TaxID=1447943 RepID=A0A6A5VRP7_9PLEO|nr:hypothetical protein BU23DRAFT_101001 [Bimuria novae-zelandiae CBS 107.79]